MTQYEQHLGRYRNYLPVDDDSERLEPAEIVREGTLRDFLEQHFLAGYIAAGPDQYADIPDLVQTALVNSVFAVGEVTHVEVSGSVAKCMAHGVPERFWDYSRSLQQELDQLEGVFPDESEEMRLIRSLSADAAADIDIKIFGPARSIPLMFDRAVTLYGVHADTIVRAPAKGIPNNGHHETRTVHFEHPTYADWDMELYEGPVPTNPSRQMMTISFIDKNSGKRGFHIDIGELPTTGNAVESDKRQGKTSLKQDICVAELTVEQGGSVHPTIRYALRQDAIAAMQGQDEIMTESNRPGDVLEIALRSLRMNLLHTVNDIPVAEGRLSLPQLGMLLPHYEVGTLFSFRARTRGLLDAMATLNDPLTIPRRELALCLTIDPYITIQALRDGGLATLIPGLSHVTREQWETVLASRHLVVEPYRTGSVEDRDIEFVTRQRDIYLNGKNHTIAPQTDGVQRFIRALRDLGVVSRSDEFNEWTLYVELWQPDEFGDQEERTLNLAKSQIWKQAEGTFLQQEYYAATQARVPGEVYNHTVELSDSRWTGAAAIYMLMQRYPAGLTALELDRLYNEYPLSVNKLYEFKQLFLDLKVLGMIKRHTVNRVSRQGRIVPVEVYTVLPRAQRQSLQELAADAEFQDMIGGAKESTELTDSVVLLLHTLQRLSGASTIEALESFTLEDYELIDKKVGAGPGVLMRVCTTLIEKFRKYKQMKDF